MTTLITEGLILRSIPYKDYDQILTLYTPDCGVLSVIVKAARSQRRGLSSAVSPLSRVECVLRKGKGELLQCREISVLNHNLFLRECVNALRTACDMVQAIRASQPPEKAAPELYKLLIKMIERLEFSPSFPSLLAAFRLKVMQHDGLLDWKSSCSHCDTPLKTPYFYKGEPFCSVHAPSGGMRFDSGEFDHLGRLIHSRSFHDIETIPISEPLSFNVKSLFEIIYL